MQHHEISHGGRDGNSGRENGAGQGFGIFSFGFARAYVTTMRPYLLFVSGITALVGLALTGSSSLIDPRVLIIFPAGFLSYGFGQALTDCFQRDTDSLSSPYRPLTRGAVSVGHVLAVSLTGLVLCVLAFGSYNPLNFIYGAASGIGLATYTWFKRRWWGGPFYNSWIVALLCFMAYSTGSPAIMPADIIWPMAAVHGMIFFGYANFVLSGYFKDIEADRATGYITFPVKFGRSASALVSDVFAVIQWLCGAAVFFFWLSPHIVPLVLFILASVIAAYAQIRLHGVRSDTEAYKAISPVVLAYIILGGAIVSGFKPEWSFFVLIYIILYLLVVSKRPEKDQL